MPLELVCRVFELAANHSPTAYSLCLVSKEARRWTIPVLYRTVTILSQAGLETSQVLEVPNAHLVRNLYLSPNVHTINLISCTKLQNLASSAHVLLRAGRFTPEVPTLTHLTIHDLPNDGPLMDTLLFPSLTHLYISNSVALPQHDFWFPAKLSRLTHIVWAGNIVPSVDELSSFLGPLELLGKLRVIGLQSQMALDPGRIAASHVEQQLAAVVRACSFRPKHKIVVMPRCTLFGSNDWNHWFQDSEDVWEAAERLLCQHE